jgi:F420-non-reducing hydrogenase iron-sulfur subunit
MCSGRVDLEFILRAFSNGQDGVFIGGCKLNECNYTTQGNYDALANTLICKKILTHLGIDPERLKIAFMNASDGILLADTINTFTRRIKELGPIGRGEGIDAQTLRFKLEAVRKLVPYIRLVERERLRVPIKSEEAYRSFYAGDDVDRLFRELIWDKLAMSQIMLLLREKPRSTGEISGALGLNASEVAKHLTNSSRQGLVRYDPGRNCYAPA